MQEDKRSVRPLEHGALRKRAAVPPEPRGATVSLIDVPLDGIANPHLVEEDGRLRLLAEVGVNGIPRRRRDRVPVTRLSAREMDPRLARQDFGGHRPAGVPTTFAPKRAERTHRLPPGRGDGRDPGAAIFDADDRYLFDDVAFPWRTTGRVRTTGATGSGTVIGPRHVLTASHVVNWTRNSDGGVDRLFFTPGYFDGSGPWGEFASERVIYWQEAPGQLSDHETAFDYAVLITDRRVGDIVGYPGFRMYDAAWNEGRHWQCIGYPGEIAGGERPAFQGDCAVASVAEHDLDGQKGLVMGHFNDITPGQSGGMIWGWWGDEPWPRVVGVTSTRGTTAVEKPTGSTTQDNEYGGGAALSALIAWARANYP